MGIVDEDIARVRDSTDIVAIIYEHVQLKRVGRRWSGLCPFHAEKSPSFSVNQELGVYKCFGCSASGDAITFVREIDHVDFVTAVETLAGKANMTLRYDDRDAGEGRNMVLALNSALLQCGVAGGAAIGGLVYDAFGPRLLPLSSLALLALCGGAYFVSRLGQPPGLAADGEGVAGGGR